MPSSMIQSIKWDGQQITVPGIYSRLPLDNYHRGDICDGPSVSSSTLRTLINTSPAHAWAACPLNPSRAEPKETEAFALGRATHHLLAAEIGFENVFAIRPEQIGGEAWQGNRTVCRKWLAQAKREGKTVLTPAQVEQIRGMAVSLGQHPLVQAGILNGLIERSMFWRDPETGLWLKARPDAIPSDDGDFSDLKTCLSTLYLDLQRSISEFGYVQQAALTFEGARALGIEASSFNLVWIEKEQPHCVRVQQLRDEDIDRGTKLNRVAVRMFADCLSTGIWPGPGDDRPDAEFVDLPEWKRTQIDERLRLQLREAA